MLQVVPASKARHKLLWLLTFSTLQAKGRTNACRVTYGSVSLENLSLPPSSTFNTINPLFYFSSHSSHSFRMDNSVLVLCLSKWSQAFPAELAGQPEDRERVPWHNNLACALEKKASPSHGQNLHQGVCSCDQIPGACGRALAVVSCSPWLRCLRRSSVTVSRAGTASAPLGFTSS